MDEQINSRIKTVMEEMRMRPSEFAAAIGISRSNLTHILSGRNQPSFAMLEKVLKAFPEIRTEWLVTGLGDMRRTSTELADTIAVMENQQRLPHEQVEMDFGEDEDVEMALEKEPSSSTIQTNDNQQNTDENDPILPSPASAVAEAAATRPATTRVRTAKSGVQTKKIRKIVFFYTDNTFEEFLPN